MKKRLSALILSVLLAWTASAAGEAPLPAFTLEENRLLYQGHDFSCMDISTAETVLKELGFTAEKDDSMLIIGMLLLRGSREQAQPCEIQLYYNQQGLPNRILFSFKQDTAAYAELYNLFSPIAGQPVHTPAETTRYGTMPETNAWALGPWQLTIYGADTATLQDCANGTCTMMLQAWCAP